MAMTEEERTLFIGLTSIAGASSLLMKAMLRVLNESVPHFKIEMQTNSTKLLSLNPMATRLSIRLPVWGIRFYPQAQGSARQVKELIAKLVAYLQSIQTEPCSASKD